MKIEQVMTSLFGFSAPTFYKWSKKERDKRPIFDLLDKYFTKEELEEFLETGEIKKMENLHKFESLSNKIVFDFFYEYRIYSDPHNFFDVLFPLFHDYIQDIKDNDQDSYNNLQDIVSKEQFYNFLFSKQHKFTFTGLIINKISELSESEFFILFTEYKETIQRYRNEKLNSMKNLLET